VEDRIGSDLLQKQEHTEYKLPLPESKAKYHLGNTVLAYPNVQKNSKDILDDKAAKEYHRKYGGCVETGQLGHILIGHGPTQETFEEKNLGTTSELFYDKKMKTSDIINPMFTYVREQKSPTEKGQEPISDSPKIQENSKDSSPKPKNYQFATGQFDKNFHKMQLRK